MISRFLSFVESNNIAIKKGKIVLATSGGIDSVVLAYLFHQLELDFAIAHCNFRLRGGESDKDEAFVRELASGFNVKFHVMKFDTAEYVKLRGISIQMAARELRYSWFEDLIEKHGYTSVATAHHRGDVAETVLFNLSKGTGLAGLHGIKAKSKNLIRPLLFASRDEIEKFAQEKKIEWREDSSNTSVKYSRNKIRHQVIPLLEEINPKAQEAIYRTSKRVEELELFLKHQFKSILKEVVEVRDHTTLIDIKLLSKIPGYGYILHQILKPFGFSYSQSSLISNGINRISGKLFYSLAHVANLDREHLIVSTKNEDGVNVLINGLNSEYDIGSKRVITKNIAMTDFHLTKSNNVLALDKAKLKFPLKIRNWKKGDVFCPLGMKGKKKLSDFMIDAKIPVNLKSKILVVLSGNEIAGVLNHRLDDRFKIVKATEEVFEISIN